MLSAFEFTLLLLCLASASATYSANECVRGESFWCSSFKNAKECSAIKHCAATVWKNDIQEIQNMLSGESLFDDCKLCTNFLNSIKMALKDKNMRMSIKILLKEELCTIFGDFKRTCQVVVDQYADEVFDLLEKEIDPNAICVFLHMCSSREISMATFHVNIAQPSNKASLNCDVCKLLIDEVKKFIGEGDTREKIEGELEKVCQLFPKTFQEECHDLVRKYSDKIIDLLLDGLETEKICQEIHMCPESKRLTFINKCESCEIVVNFIESLLDRNSTIEGIETAARRACTLLPPKYREYCNNLIEEFGALIIKSLVEHLKPHETCTLLNMCNSVRQHEPYYKCIAGPKYWCASEANAKLCEAEEHCRKSVWK